jgi:hypothetical protein
MSGSIYLYISNKGEVHKIPKPNYSEYKAVPSLANQEVLLATLIYKTLNRKPFELETVSFHKDILDKDGILKFDLNSIHDVLLYLEGPESAAECDELIPLPKAPSNIPTPIEKNALYSYIKERYPTLWPNCSYLVEQHIKSIEGNLKKKKNFVKQVYKIKSKMD